MTKCLICGKEFSERGLGSHLLHVHNLTPKDYYDTHIKKDNEGICYCGNPTVFRSISKGYAKFCSAKCAANDPNVKESKFNSLTNKSPEEKQAIENKKRKTKLERYGSETYNNGKQAGETKKNYSDEQRNDIYSRMVNTKIEKYGSAQNMDKIKATKLKKYGDENYNNLDKYKKTCLERYGVDNFFKTSEFDEKNKSTRLAKYGDENYSNHSQMKVTKENKRTEFENKYKCTSVILLVAEYGQGWYKAKIISDYLEDKSKQKYVKNEDIQKIIDYASINHHEYYTSKYELEIIDFIKTFYTNTINSGDTNAINPLELDIYMPENKLAIEFDGVYWHSDLFKDKNYHLMKTELCESKDIRLIHIFEDDWVNKQEICKSIIKGALGYVDETIYARNCKVITPKHDDVKLFLETNHIQGYINSSYQLGLEYKGELVQLITIGKSRFEKDTYELLRMCTKLNTRVVGGFSKLIKHCTFNRIISYVDRSLFSASGYLKIGFKQLSFTGPGYFYYSDKTGRLNRIQCQKHKLKNILGDDFDPNLTESENMKSAGFYKLYNCGNYKMEYIKN